MTPDQPSNDTIAGRIRREGTALTPAETKVAHVVATNPQLVAFGTVAEVARSAQASGASVVRFGNRLGYEGFVGLQTAVQQELAQQLRPAARRIRDRADDDVISSTMHASLTTLQATFDAIDPATFGQAVELLADQQRALRLMAGDAGAGILRHAADELSMLRPGVSTVAGNPVAVARQLATTVPGDAALVLDLRRYDRWLLDAVELSAARGARIVALTDSPVSPVALRSHVSLVIGADTPGPFDNYVGALSLLTALVTGVARRDQRSATTRLDQIEQAWTDGSSLSE